MKQPSVLNTADVLDAIGYNLELERPSSREGYSIFGERDRREVEAGDDYTQFKTYIGVENEDYEIPGLDKFGTDGVFTVDTCNRVPPLGSPPRERDIREEVEADRVLEVRLRITYDEISEQTTYEEVVREADEFLGWVEGAESYRQEM